MQASRRLRGEGKGRSYRVYRVLLEKCQGTKVLEVSGNTASAEIDLTELANGVYYAAVVSENGTAVVRVVKN